MTELKSTKINMTDTFSNDTFSNDTLSVHQKVIVSLLQGTQRNVIIAELLLDLENLFTLQNLAIMNEGREAILITKTPGQLPMQLSKEVIISNGDIDVRFLSPLLLKCAVLPLEPNHFLCLESHLEFNAKVMKSISLFIPIIEKLLIPQIVESCITKDLTIPLVKIMKSAKSAQQTIASGREPHLEAIITNATKLANSINNIVDYEKIQQGKLTLTLNPLFIDRLVAQVLRMIHNPSKIVIDLSLPPNIPLVNGDVEKLTQVLLCVIQNAVDYSKSKSIRLEVGAMNIITTRKDKKRYSLPLPTLTKNFDMRPTSLLSSASPRANSEVGLRSKRPGAEGAVLVIQDMPVEKMPTQRKKRGEDVLRSDWKIGFKIKDQGVGMTHEEIEGLFKFGPKLSLTVTKHLVSIMGGNDLTITSKGKGCGTEVCFTIVFAECIMDADDISVMVVDEDADRRLEMLGILSEVDIKAVVASSMKEAVYCTNKVHPNIVIATKKIDIPDAYIIHYKKNMTKEDVIIKLYEACVAVNKKQGAHIGTKKRQEKSRHYKHVSFNNET